TGLRAVAVLADRREHRPEGRIQDPAQTEDREGNPEEREVVEAHWIVQRDLPSEEAEGQLRDAAQAVVTAREIRQVEGDEVEQLGEGEREHREVDAAAAEREEADDRAARARGRDADGQGQPHRGPAELRERDPRPVGAEAEVGGVAERQEAGVAVEQVEADREETIDEHLRGQRLVGNDERQDREEGDDRHAGMLRDPPEDGSHVPYSARPGSPKRPLGRTRSTTAMTRNTTISAILGAKKLVTLTTSPIRRPATTAPKRLPMPPTTTTTKHSMMI